MNPALIESFRDGVADILDALGAPGSYAGSPARLVVEQVDGEAGEWEMVHEVRHRAVVDAAALAVKPAPGDPLEVNAERWVVDRVLAGDGFTWTLAVRPDE
ncbi:hypothetical protein MARPU_05760 [Marichromatium purpuratum 984]|uniref:Uncharacterized protein n=1 Tax=Marichromatium purpuratum 984 TaxID=765910 RepID=W0E8M8_MARPU|nr:hypothetical protein [Marichromatium purpuratum]AHF05416.1 hypothetical protein MARPU_05760 [Marichromatium purpuratum 984]